MKIYDLCGLKHHIVEMRGGATDAGQTTNKQKISEDGATLNSANGRWRLSFAISPKKQAFQSGVMHSRES